MTKTSAEAGLARTMIVPLALAQFIASYAATNAFAAVDDPAGLQAIWTVWDRRRFRRCWTSGWR